VTAKNKALLCALAGSRNAYDTTNGYCFDWNSVDSTSGGIVFGNVATATYDGGSNAVWAAAEVFKTDSFRYSA